MYLNQDILFARMQVGGIFLGILAVSLLVRQWMMRRLAKSAAGKAASFAAVLREDLATPTLLWCLVISADVLLGLIELSAKAERIGHVLVVSFLILSLTMVANSVVMRTLQAYGERHGVPFAVAGLSRTLTRAVVYGLGLSTLLAFLGISITPIWTALGVGGLAVALALQDTLANLFAGVHILIERPIAVGDFVRLSAEEEGMVSDIGWRTTRLVTGANNTVVIPNKTITAVNLLNYSMPSAEMGVWVPVLMGLDADVSQAERIALAAAAQTEGVLAEPAPAFIADPGMVLTHLQYRLSFRVAQYTHGGIARTRVVQRILDGFRQAGIPLPEVRRM